MEAAGHDMKKDKLKVTFTANKTKRSQVWQISQWRNVTDHKMFFFFHIAHQDWTKKYANIHKKCSFDAVANTLLPAMNRWSHSTRSSTETFIFVHSVLCWLEQLL